MESERRLDPIDFLRRLHALDIRWLLVGRQALVLLGAPLLSADYDFYISPEQEDLEAVLVLAGELVLEVSPKRPGRAPFFYLLSDDLKLNLSRARSYRTVRGERFTFDALHERRKVISVEDFAVPVPAIPDLIRTKLVRNSPSDREDLKYLRALLERGDR